MRRHAAHLDTFGPEPAQRGQPSGIGRAEILELQADRAGIFSDDLLSLADLVAGESSVDVDVAAPALLCDGDAQRHGLLPLARVVPVVRKFTVV
jgi:hypothetical protein